MIKLNQAVIVEGKYDKIKLSSIIDAVIIETDGFRIFKDKEKQKLIKKLAEKKGLLIITDSDSAGFKIRSFLKGIIEADNIYNAYIPEIRGKEKRKSRPSKEGTLGVEGVSKEIIESALKKSGIFFETEEFLSRKITALDFYEDGLSGKKWSRRNKEHMLKMLDLPSGMSTKSFLEIANFLMTYDEYKQLVSKIF